MFCIYYDRLTSLSACTPILKPIRRRVFSDKPAWPYRCTIIVGFPVTIPGERRTTDFTVCAPVMLANRKKDRERKIDVANKQYPP